MAGLSPRVRGNRGAHRGAPLVRGSIPACAGEPQECQSQAYIPPVYPRVCGGTPRRQPLRQAESGLSPRVRGNPTTGAVSSAEAGSIPACAGEPRLGHDVHRHLGVYPRVCGGTQWRPNDNTRRMGLSPRVRGNRCDSQLETLEKRSIPACAGEPDTPDGWEQPARVYPRVCGGTMVPSSPGPARSGLSPRVRGNLNRPRVSHDCRGSIPACAGEPQLSRLGRDRGAVYPRVCGGTTFSLVYRRDSWGLSPRVRGNLNRPRVSHDCRGSIPACAGEPRCYGDQACQCGVYPRVCGGTRVERGAVVGDGGLSPRVRGNPDYLISDIKARGSIPACAGEPNRYIRHGQGGWVYPRVCGGTALELPWSLVGQGLSPRVRGNHRVLLFPGALLRSIPACAGEPPGRGQSGRATGVYPRVCGGTCLRLVMQVFGNGLSPRVRGNRTLYHHRRKYTRSIPACAGEPSRR